MSITTDHERAQVMAALQLSEVASDHDRAWLRGHLSECRKCADFAAGLADGLATLRSISLPANPALVAATQRRVRDAAATLQEQRNSRRLLALSGLMAAGMTGAAGISLWHLLGWLVRDFEVAPVTLAPVLLALWFLPGILAGAAAWACQGSESRWNHPNRVFE
jgi:hypothetical protein